MDIPQLEQIKIQAKILVPLVKALRAELGLERANALIARALGDHYRKAGERCWRQQTGADLGEKMAATWDWFAAENALDRDVVSKTADAFDLNITGCRYAEFYKEIGEPELGFLLVCSADFPMTEGFDNVALSRTQTIMQGASHCDFRYKLKT
jgi:hypothetical protein